MRVFLIKPILYAFIGAVVFVACKSSARDTRKINKDYAFVQKVTIKKMDSLKLELDSVTSNYIPCLQYRDDKNAEQLIYLNEETGRIYINDITTRKITKCITPKLPEEKLKKKFQGFYYHNKDSIFIFAFAPKVLLINDSGTIKNTYEISSLQAGQEDRIFYQAAYVTTRNRPVFYNQQLLINAIMLGNLRPNEQRKTQIWIDLASKKTSLGTQYFPDAYYKNFGGMDYYIYATTYNPVTNEMIYSYPALDSVIIYSLSKNKATRVYFGSQYINEIPQFNADDYKQAPSGIEGEYFMQNPSFGPILFDPYRNIYYRLAFLKVDEKNAVYETKNAPTKQVSLVVYDNNFNFLGESILEKNKFWPNSVFVSKQGLHIQNKTETDETLDFTTFTVN
jgi:hypothetical protein